MATVFSDNCIYTVPRNYIGELSPVAQENNNNKKIIDMDPEMFRTKTTRTCPQVQSSSGNLFQKQIMLGTFLKEPGVRNGRYE
jgi:hypothetical protein